MKYKFLLLIFLVSCTTNYTKIKNLTPLNSKGFAYIYNVEDYENKLIKGKLDNSKMQISHKNLKINSFIKIENPTTKDSIVLKNVRKIDYPDFYKILITEQVAEKLNLKKDLPFVEILEIKKNKSFVAKKAKIFNEEKKISSNAPVASVQISNISKNKDLKKKIKKEEFYIVIGSFYEESVASFLKERITKEIPKYDTKKLKIVKKSIKETNLISGPYYTINFMKNDYILLKQFGFEELDIIND
mgnify:CR=1 FL=1|tara:strand:+ start:1140 stop:1871 length:732 start_codon:yes stop_codon:yes gene_type:complete